MKKIFILFVLLCCVSAGVRAQESQHIVVGAGFETYFDNREYSGNGFDRSQTLFSARLTPRVGWQWNGRHRVVFGVEMMQNFGDDERFLSEVRPLMYYRYLSGRVKAMAGIFERRELCTDAYPLAMMSG